MKVLQQLEKISTHSDRGPSGAQVSVACQNRMLRGAV